MGVNVEVQVLGNIDAAIKKFNKECKNEQIIETYKRKRYYEKPSEIKRRKLDKRKRNEHKLSGKSKP